LRRIALRSVRAHPEYVAEVVARNAAATFELNPGRNRSPELQDGRDWSFRSFTLPLFYVVTAFGCFGIAKVLSNRDSRLLVATVAYFLTANLLLVAPPRLRAPFDLLSCIGAGIAIDRLLRNRARHTNAKRDVRSPRQADHEAPSVHPA